MKHQIELCPIGTEALAALPRPIRSEPFRIGRHKLQFEFTGTELRAHWAPLPKARARGLLRPYKRARHDFLTRVARETGLRMAVVDI